MSLKRVDGQVNKYMYVNLLQQKSREYNYKAMVKTAHFHGTTILWMNTLMCLYGQRIYSSFAPITCFCDFAEKIQNFKAN